MTHQVVLRCGREKPEHVGDRYVAPPRVLESLPDALDLRDRIASPWPAWQQGSLNTCTAHAVGGAVWYLALRRVAEDGADPFEPSRAFLYAFEDRLAQQRLGSPDPDPPCYMHEAVQVVKNRGVCADALWTYPQRNWLDLPPDDVQQAARAHRPVHDWKVDLDGKQIKASVSEGYPVTIGLVMHEECEPHNTRDGHFPVPDKKSPRAGGHAILIIGWDDARDRFLIRNSWGARWGEQGYGTLPYAYALDPDLADSTWTIRYRE